MRSAADVRSFFHSLSTGDRDRLLGFLHDDVVLVFPGDRFGGEFRGKRKVGVFLRQNRRLFRDGLRFDVSWAAVVDGHAVAQWTNAGVTRDGVEYANRGVTVFELDDAGLVVRLDDYLDTGLMSRTWS